MRLPFGLEIRKAVPLGSSTVPGSAGFFPLTINEPFMGAWQRNRQLTPESVLAHHAVYACITLIANDVGKLRPKLVELDSDDIWTETTSPAFSPVLRKPNSYQNHIQFKEWWMLSKLIHGNAYALLVRDRRQVVTAMLLLDPTRVRVLVAPDGSVFYQLGADNLSEIDPGGITVPASEILHDRMNCLFHPLVGTSPIFACGMAANIGLRIQDNSAGFFGKGSNPSGVLTVPTVLTDDTAKRFKEEWEAAFSGNNAGAVAVLEAGMTFVPMQMNNVDSQLIEQLKWSAETVCSAFHVPPFKIGIGSPPTYANAAEAMNQVYYSDCLQSHIESWEAVVDEGLGLTEAKDGVVMGVELDLTGLIRMDRGAQIDVLTKGIGGGLFAPNEARKEDNKKPLPGGDAVYLQEQYFSLEALSKRDQNPAALEGPKPEPTPTQAPPEEPPDDEIQAAVADLLLKALDDRLVAT